MFAKNADSISRRRDLFLKLVGLVVAVDLGLMVLSVNLAGSAEVPRAPTVSHLSVESESTPMITADPSAEATTETGAATETKAAMEPKTTPMEPTADSVGNRTKVTQNPVARQYRNDDGEADEQGGKTEEGKADLIHQEQMKREGERIEQEEEQRRSLRTSAST